jgi:hypothetical protein
MITQRKIYTYGRKHNVFPVGIPTPLPTPLNTQQRAFSNIVLGENLDG